MTYCKRAPETLWYFTEGCVGVEVPESIPIEDAQVWVSRRFGWGIRAQLVLAGEVTFTDAVTIEPRPWCPDPTGFLQVDPKGGFIFSPPPRRALVPHSVNLDLMSLVTPVIADALTYAWSDIPEEDCVEWRARELVQKHFPKHPVRSRYDLDLL